MIIKSSFAFSIRIGFLPFIPLLALFLHSAFSPHTQKNTSARGEKKTRSKQNHEIKQNCKLTYSLSSSLKSSRLLFFFSSALFFNACSSDEKQTAVRTDGTVLLMLSEFYFTKTGQMKQCTMTFIFYIHCEPVNK